MCCSPWGHRVTLATEQPPPPAIETDTKTRVLVTRLVFCPSASGENTGQNSEGASFIFISWETSFHLPISV